MQITTKQRVLALLIVTFISLSMTSGAVAADTPVAPCQGEGLTDATVRSFFQAGNSVYAYCQGWDTAQFTLLESPDTVRAPTALCQGEGLTDATVRSTFQAAGDSVCTYCKGLDTAEHSHQAKQYWAGE